MSTHGFGMLPFRTAPMFATRPQVMPSHAFVAQRPAPVWQHAQPNYAAEMQRQQMLKRQDELRRLEMQRRGGGWRSRPAPVVNNYYTSPAPITQQAPTVAVAPVAPQVLVPPSMPAPQPDVSPGVNTADMGPTQDAAAANADAVLPPASASPGDPNEHPVHKYGRKIIIGLVVAVAAFGGYKLYQKHKKGKHAAPHGHGMQGFRRRRGR